MRVKEFIGDSNIAAVINPDERGAIHLLAGAIA